MSKKGTSKSPMKPKKTKIQTEIVHSRSFNDGTLLEAVFVAGRPKFLCKERKTGRLAVVAEYPRDGILYQPPSKAMIGYAPYELPYGAGAASAPTTEELVQKLLDEWRAFVDCSEDLRKLNVAFTLLTYCVEKLVTTPYLGYFGDTETGKNQRATLHAHLDYRAFNGVDTKEADIYELVERVGGVLIEDEQDIGNDIGAKKIWKAGYKADSRVTRIITSQLTGRRSLVYFSPFGPKIALGERQPEDKGLRERFIVELTLPGNPTRDEFSKKDFARFTNLSRLLLIWRIQNWDKPLPNIEVPFRGRAKELYKPLLQVVYGTTIYGDLQAFLERLDAQRTESAQRTWEALLTKAAVVTIDVTTGICLIDEVRDSLAALAGGEHYADYRGAVQGVQSNELGRITNRGIANRFKLLFGGKSVRLSPEPSRQERGWKLDIGRLLLEAKKYRLEVDEEAIEVKGKKFVVGVRVRELAKSPTLQRSLHPPFANVKDKS